ncbi:MAG: S41 family peptidase [Candidatus Roseilinea sp.]|uniref:S41 family peptidase n=1 Tax=Candidatus Roseilinea sp. TaxID=2838777 RepID=UPI0040498DBF
MTDHFRDAYCAIKRLGRKAGLVAWRIVAALVMTACSTLPLPGRNVEPAPQASLDLPSATQGRLRDFDLLIKTLRERYIDPGRIDDAWLDKAAAFRRSISTGAIDNMDNDAYAQKLAELLTGLDDPAVALWGPLSEASRLEEDVPFGGIGVLVGMPKPGKDRLVVLTVYEGSPAEKAGIMPHDSIVAVDSRPVRYEERDSVLGRVRGPVGTTVTLTIRSPGQAEREVIIQRAPIVPASQTVARRIPGTSIAYLSPGQGDPESLPIQITRALRALAADKALHGIILDLRVVQDSLFPINPMLSLFANGPVGARHMRSGQQKIEVNGKQVGGSQDLPLVILIGDQTQGPAVSFAAMLQDLGRATLVGTNTSPLVAEVFTLNLPETGLQLVIPSAEYRGIKGRVMHGTGLAPDENIQLGWEDFSVDNDLQLERAIALLRR